MQFKYYYIIKLYYFKLFFRYDKGTEFKKFIK